MKWQRFKTDAGVYMWRVDKREARRLYAHGYTVLIGNDLFHRVVTNETHMRLQGTRSTVETFAPAEKYDVRAKRFNNLVKSFERCMCRNDTNRYAFFHVPVHYLKYPGMWDIRESFTDTRYMAGFKEWTLDGLKEEGKTA